MSARTNRLGARGEDTAAAFLEESGATILTRNWRDGRRGEIDIVAGVPRGPRPGVAVVEVRTRVGNQRGSALESVDSRKIARLRALAGAWRRANPGPPGELRIDVVAITIDPGRARELGERLASCADLRQAGARVEWIRGVA